MKGSVYLSYSGRNCEAVLQVMEAVIYGGQQLVCDCMLPGHQSFDQRISRAIKDAALIVAVITDDGESCTYMERELEIALEMGKRLLPIVVENARLPKKHAQALLDIPCCHVSEYPTRMEMDVVRTAISEAIE